MSKRRFHFKLGVRASDVSHESLLLASKITQNNFAGVAVIQKGRKHVHSKKKIITAPSTGVFIWVAHRCA